MFGKLFASMFDGSLHGQWEAIITLQQLVILCDRDGIVDITPRALAARTSIPIALLERGIAALEAADDHSRTPGEGGRRIVRIHPDRPWGWRIVNYERYRGTRDAEDRRAQNRDAQERRRRKLAADEAGQPASAAVSHGQPPSAQAEAEAKAEEEATPVATPGRSGTPSPGRRRAAGPCGPAADGVGPEDLPQGLLLETGETYRVRAEDRAEYERTYPRLDVGAQLDAMAAWLHSNPGGRKTRRGILRFVNGWLARAERERLGRLVTGGVRTGRDQADADYFATNGLAKAASHD